MPFGCSSSPHFFILLSSLKSNYNLLNLLFIQ
jgi:hypothetical protein